jgi:hypothetical protein
MPTTTTNPTTNQTIIEITDESHLVSPHQTPEAFDETRVWSAMDFPDLRTFVLDMGRLAALIEKWAIRPRKETPKMLWRDPLILTSGRYKATFITHAKEDNLERAYGVEVITTLYVDGQSVWTYSYQENTWGAEGGYDTGLERVLTPNQNALEYKALNEAAVRACLRTARGIREWQARHIETLLTRPDSE